MQNKTSRRITYIMNVDWHWVKQRPHFLAQHLSRYHDVIVLYPYAFRRGNLVRNNQDGIRLYPFFRLPFGGTFAIIYKLNAYLLRVMSRLFLLWHQPEIVWISSPELFEYLPRKISSILIYDCMDDILSFPRKLHRRELLAKSEKELVNAATYVFCSSKNLRDKLVKRVGHSGKYYIVHNAFEPSAFLNFLETPVVKKKDERYVLGYIGTVSSWLDFEILVKIVSAYPSIEIHLLGPIENLAESCPGNDRIRMLGAVPHHDIQRFVNGFDALLIPFRITELIESVDPVKLYEYVFFNKPIISVRYPEIERFSDFVDFYTNSDELLLTLKRYLAEGFIKKYSDDDRARFISSNSWANRINCIQEILSK